MAKDVNRLIWETRAKMQESGATEAAFDLLDGETWITVHLRLKEEVEHLARGYQEVVIASQDAFVRIRKGA